MRFLLLITIIFAHHLAYSQFPEWSSQSFDQNIEIAFLESDSLGFIWVCSKTELYRFDGQNLESKLKLEENEFTAVSKNHQGELCLATKNGTCYLFTPSNCTISCELSDLAFENITNLYIHDENNYLLISYGNGLLLKKNDEQYHLTKAEGLLSDELYDLSWQDGKYFIGTDQGIQILDVEDEKYKLDAITLSDGIPDLVITNIENDNGVLWFTDYRRNVGKINIDHSIEYFSFERNSKIHDLQTRDNQIFVANDDGVFQIKSGHWIKKYPEEGSQRVNHILHDIENNLWIRSSKNSIKKGNLSIEKYPANFENARTIFKVDNFFLVGKEGGLYKQIGAKLEKLNGKNITFIAQHNEYILVGTFSDGALLYDKNLNLIDQKQAWMGISNQSVLSIFSDEKNIYISSLSGVMKFKINHSKLLEVESINETIGQDYIYTISKSGDDLIFGTDRHGLIKWNQITDQVQKIKNFKNGKKIGSVYSITATKSDQIWFSSSQQGIGYLQGNDAIVSTTLENNLEEYTTISSLLDGQILLVRASSIDIFNPETSEVRNFHQMSTSNNESEFLNSIVHEGNRSYILHQNRILSYSPSGVEKQGPTVVIDEVLVNLSPVQNKHTFNEGECNIEFKFKGVWLSDPTSLRYRYKLEGFDNDWRDTRNNTVAFPKLAPGNYIFKLQCTNNENFINASSIDYSFDIEAYWYNETSSRLLIFGAGLFLLYLVFRNHDKRKSEKQAMEQLKIENQLNSLKNQLNPHFLFNSFNSLIALIEENKPKSIEFVERLSDFYRNMLELGKLDLVSLSKEIELLEQYMSILKTRFNGQLIFETNYDDLEEYAIPPFSLQMLIENAVKHNVVSTKDPLHVKILKNENFITIWNKKNRLLSSSEGTKTGLENIRRRFELAGLSEPVINDSNDFFEVSLNLKKL